MDDFKTVQDFKNKEKEIKRNLIIDAAERVFANKPYDKVSMQEIAEEAGLSKAAIYTYFKNQESLFMETALRELDILLKTLDDITIKRDGIQEIINTFISFFIEHDSFFRMAAMFMLYGTMGDDTVKKFNSAIKKLMESFDMVFEKSGYKGNVRLLSHTIFTALSGILISYRKYPGRSEEERVRHMNHIGKTYANMFKIFIDYQSKK